MKAKFTWYVAGLMVSTASAFDCTLGDGDGDADVDFEDFQNLQICFTGQGGFAGAECEAFDFDEDGDVDLDDYDGFESSVTGPTEYFDYGPSPLPNFEAELLALETGPDLFADLVMYERIKRDLALIRDFQPDAAGAQHDPTWLPDEMIVFVLDDLPRCEFDALNVLFQVTAVDFLFQSGGGIWYVVHYPGRMRIPVLTGFYETLPEVGFAEPNFLIGTDDHITVVPGPDGVWTYHIEDGFHDCFDGCDCHIFWIFEVDPKGNVEQTSLQCSGLPWCTFPDFCFGGE